MERLQFHVLAFEGPDPYARAGGLAGRVDGLTQSLARLGFETHLWFVGDPEAPVHEVHGMLHHHRWSQWLSRHHTGGVYDGEWSKQADYAQSLPPHLLGEVLAPHLRAGGRAVVMGEEWHTVHAVLHLDHLLREQGLRERVDVLWNADSAHGFEHVPWSRLRAASWLTTASRALRRRMEAAGADAVLVVPNGLPHDAFDEPDGAAASALRACLAGSTLLVKEARGHAGRGWAAALAAVAELKRERAKPLLVALGDVGTLEADARRLGLRWSGLGPAPRSAGELVAALSGVREADIVGVQGRLAPVPRRLLLQGAHGVLAGSADEPLGLAGLEAMAVGGITFNGYPREDYVIDGHNALMLESADAGEFVQLYLELRDELGADPAMRQAARSTARRFAWHEVLRQRILPRLSAAAQAAALPLLLTGAAESA